MSNYSIGDSAFKCVTLVLWAFFVFRCCFFRYFSFQVLSSSFFNLNLVNPVLLCLISLGEVGAVKPV